MRLLAWLRLDAGACLCWPGCAQALAPALPIADSAAVLQPTKGHPRDFIFRGRARVSLRKEDGSLFNPDIPSRTPRLR